VLVVDASALVTALTGTTESRRALRRRLMVEQCHAPHFIDAELGNALRGQVRRRALPDSAAAALLVSGPELIDSRYEVTDDLARRAWSMRENLPYYDALYVALARQLGCTMLTGDGRLARAPRLGAPVELVD
jgi:predicted nucleic acid-binding protein